jgi:hypothetical protein
LVKALGSTPPRLAVERERLGLRGSTYRGVELSIRFTPLTCTRRGLAELFGVSGILAAQPQILSLGT